MEIIFEHYNMFRIVKSSVGFKLVNVKMFRMTSANGENTGLTSKRTFEVDASKLFLSIDFLRDQYSLLGCNIVDSPHYELMSILATGGSIKKSNYISRFKKGTLDARYPHIVRNYNFFYNKFEDMKCRLDNCNMDPVLVFKVADAYYIKDGKHRAALCAYYNKPIICQLLDSKNMVGNVGRVVAGLIGSDTDYSKHVRMYNQLRTVEKNG